MIILAIAVKINVYGSKKGFLNARLLRAVIYYMQFNYSNKSIIIATDFTDRRAIPNATTTGRFKKYVSKKKKKGHRMTKLDGFHRAKTKRRITHTMCRTPVFASGVILACGD